MLPGTMWERLRTRNVLIGVAFSCLYVTTASRVEAQDKASTVIRAAENAVKATQIDTALVKRIAAAADTGRMSPGYRDISRYNTPGYCFAAVLGVENAIWRRGERGHSESGAVHDTLPTAAVEIGKKCMAALPSVAQTRPIDLSNLLRLSIVLGDTARFEAIIARQIALAKTVEKKGYVYLDAIEELLATKFPTLISHPADIPGAIALAARLDDLGTEARIPRMQAYANLANIASTRVWDTSAILRADVGLRNAVKLLTPAERLEYTDDITLMYDSVKIAWYQRPQNLLATERGIMDRHFATVGPGALTNEQVTFWTEMVADLASQVGKPAPPITGKFWFPADAQKMPEPGVVTMVMLVDKEAGLMSARLAMLQRVYNRFHARGFDILLVVKTQGYSWSSPPLSAEDEAKTIEWYFRDYLKLPFKIMVDETPFTVRDDGIREPGRIAFERQYSLPGQALIGRDGRIMSQWLGFESEAQMNAFVEQALEMPVAGDDAGRREAHR